jgi:hypothetical protein
VQEAVLLGELDVERQDDLGKAFADPAEFRPHRLHRRLARKGVADALFEIRHHDATTALPRSTVLAFMRLILSRMLREIPALKAWRTGSSF